MPVTEITLVTEPACHFCVDARQALEDIGHQVPLRVEVIEADSPAGAALIAEHRPAMFPLVLLDGRYFSAGRLPRRKLAARLAAVPTSGGQR